LRIRSKWSAKNRDRTPEEIAGVVGFIAWRICTEAVLELENNNFQTDTQVQRLAIIWEFAAFLIHVTDRMMYDRMDEEERAVFISAMAKAMAQTMQDNMEDYLGNGFYKPDLIHTLNVRMNEYSKFGYSDESGPSFPMLRYFGEWLIKNWAYLSLCCSKTRDDRWWSVQTKKGSASRSLFIFFSGSLIQDQLVQLPKLS